MTIQRLWKGQGLVLETDYDVVLSEFEDKRADQNWRARGRSLYQQGYFEDAAYAFERADRPEEAAIAKAYHLKQSAIELTPSAKQKARKDAFVRAAEALSESAQGTRVKEEKHRILQSAAECYSEVSLYTDAANMYRLAERWNEAVIHYFKAKMLDEAVEIVLEHRDIVEKRLYERIIDSARYAYLKEVKIEYVS